MHARDLVPLASRYEADARYAILHPTGMRLEIGLGRNSCRRSGTGADSAWNGCRLTLEGLTVYVGIITLKKDAAISDIDAFEDTLNELCASELADYKCPVGYKLLKSLPLTNSGKIDVMALRADAENQVQL
jgi:hypothetical protein